MIILHYPHATGLEASKQSSWDAPRVKACFSSLLDLANDKSSARLLAAKRKESGAWLTAPPTSSLGLRMDDETVRTAIGLRLGSAPCHPHSYLHCGQFLDELGLHGLSCRYSKGRNPRHSALNDLIKQSLSSINIPSTLEPRGLCLSNDSHPDGVTIIPWSQGRCLAWDATCHDTFAPTNLPLTCTGAGLLAHRAAQKKQEHY